MNYKESVFRVDRKVVAEFVNGYSTGWYRIARPGRSSWSRRWAEGRT